MNDSPSADASYRSYLETQAIVNEGNKRSLFDALAAAKISEVYVDFDGVGDSGQIDSVTALRGKARTELPETNITIQLVRIWHDPKPLITEATLEQAIETLCYGYLEERHAGWENDDGACGQFRFNVAKRTVKLEFNARYSDTQTTNSTF
jgi:hypothetical protein